MSGRKDSLPKFQIVTAGAMAGNVTSLITNIQYMDNIGIQVNITSGSASGTFNVQVSADHVQTVSNGTPIVTTAGTFISLSPTALYQATITAGSPSTIYFDITEISAPYIQLLWTNSGGSGTFDAFIVGKMI